MKFIKMQGLGNDYLFLNCLNGEPENLPALTVRMSDRHFGAGSDGVICLCPAEQGDFRMRIFNADGSEGEMCGNGIRCLARYIWDSGLSTSSVLKIETKAGLRQVWTRGEAVQVDMGRPQLSEPIEVEALGQSWRLVPVSMGNPHGVLLLDSIDGLELSSIGPALERHPAFPGGINVEFVRVLHRNRLQMRVWERGSGETLACGTGACAALAAAVFLGLSERSAQVELPGGCLEVCWDEQTDSMLMSGPAAAVYEGEYFL